MFRVDPYREEGKMKIEDWKECSIYLNLFQQSLSTPMGVDYVVIGLDMEVQPLVTHNAA